jgi:hypothetical protein
MTTTANTEQLIALRAAVAEKNKALFESAAIEAEMAVLSNDALQKALVTAELRNQQTIKLQDMINQIKALFELIPLRDRHNRTRRPSVARLFGCGTHADLMVQLATLVQYAPKEHKDMVSAIAPISPELAESLLFAMGRTAYFDSATGVMRDEVQASHTNAQLIMQMLATSLHVFLELSEFTSTSLAAQFTSARIKAETDQLAYIKVGETTDSLFVM